MSTKKKICTIFTVLAALVIFAFPVTTYAGENEISEYDAYDYEITIPTLSLESYEGLGAFFESLPEPQIFTPPGNLTLVDDFFGDTARQFITVTTRNGHFFYIIIDRAADRDNVHFLNQVNELDLFMILEEEMLPHLFFEVVEPVQEEPVPKETPVPEVIPDEAPAPKQRGGMNGIILTLVIFAAIGGGAIYYFKLRKPKQNKNNATATNQSEFEFYDDDGVSFDEDEDIPDFTISEELSFEAAESEGKNDE
jgi:hypothetical protein